MDNKNLQKFKVGDTVSTEELAKTQGVYFILSNTKLDDNNTFTIGKIEYISKEKDEQFKEVYNQCIQRYSKKPLVFINPYIGGNEAWEHF